MPLSSNQVKKELEKLPVEWVIIGSTNLVKVFEFKNYRSTVGFVVLVVELAEKADHHPEVRLSWGKAEVSLTTHGESGLTQKDFELAKSIEAIEL